MALRPGVNRATSIWLSPFLMLTGAAIALFVITLVVDAFASNNPVHAILLFFRPNPAAAAQTLSNAAQVVAAILGIAITVIAIIVELAANRYTHRITELFVGSPINFFVMGFFVIAALQCSWVSLTFDVQGAEASGFVPSFGTGVAMVLLALCLLILIPYFAFVFRFLSPVEIVHRIRSHTMEVIESPSRDVRMVLRQREAVRGVEQLTDIGINAMQHNDKGIAVASVDALQSMLIEYQYLTAKLPESWFRVEGELAHNADFVAMSSDVLDVIGKRKTWFEMKVLRQYQTIYNEALNQMRDVNHLIAMNTRQLATLAVERENQELYELVLKFFNTYLRATINARDVRTVYNVLYQYRLLAEKELQEGRSERAIEIATYFRYYGLVAYNASLPFVLETVAYDLCSLNEVAFDCSSPAIDELLRIFLDVDKESESEVQETSLRGVRKAQAKLATYYLAHADEKHARKVFDDMKEEKPDRLASIRNELLSVESSEFWEISDRGVNFDYLTPERKEKLIEFYHWFGSLPPLQHSDRPPAIPSVAPMSFLERKAVE